MNPDYAKVVNALADAVRELNVETPTERGAAAAADAAAAEHSATSFQTGRKQNMQDVTAMLALNVFGNPSYSGASSAPPAQQPNAPAQPNKKNAKKVKLPEAFSDAASAAW
jgi:hypothetical protein